MNSLRRCRYGMMSFNIRDIWVGRSLDTYGECCEAEFSLLRNIVNDGYVVLDIGAGIGTHTLPLSRMVGKTGRVLSYEPERRSFYHLCANLALNDIRNVFPFQQAVGGSASTVAVPELDDEATMNYGGLELWKDYTGSATYPVTMVTIDSIGLARCDVIKIDVEGMEADVVAGAVDTLKKFRPYLYIENDPRQNTGLRDLLDSLGYRTYIHSAPLYNTYNFYGVSHNIFTTPDGAGYISEMLYCHPSESPSPIQFGDSAVNSKCSLPAGSKGTTSCAEPYRKEKGDFETYLSGHGIDIGGGYDVLHSPFAEVENWDVQHGDATLLSTAPDAHYDFVYSSHCLEHISDLPTAILNWCRVIKPGGVFFVCIPDWDLYEQRNWPSQFNSDHKQTFSITVSRSEVGRPNHWNVREDLEPLLNAAGVSLVERRLEDYRYDYDLPKGIDQTGSARHALAQICLIGRKSL